MCRSQAPPPVPGESKEEQELKYAAFMNVPIIFYGRVLDQDSHPVLGAVVSSQVDMATNLVEHYAGANPITKCGDVTTDGDGLFTISGQRGYVLSITSITGSGYRAARRNAGFSYDRRLPQCHQPDPDKPVEFMLIKDDLPKAEKVYDKRLKVPWHAGPVIIDLGQEVGKLRVASARQGFNPANRRISFEWSADVHAEGFEITPLPDPGAWIAPVDGYEDRHLYKFSRNMSAWVSRVDDRYAIRTSAGNYGLMELSVYGDGDERGMSTSVTIYLNRSGVRNIDHK